MEQKLAKYRAEKLMNQRKELRRQIIQDYFTLGALRRWFETLKISFLRPIFQRHHEILVEQTNVNSFGHDIDDDDDNGISSDDLNNSEDGMCLISKLDWAIIIVKFALWSVFLYLSIKIEFCAVFLLTSGFALIWLNLRRSSRQKDTNLSAYSVFNPNLEKIGGTFDAEQFDAQLRRGGF